MRKVELYTADKQYVATVEIPPFQTLPGVLVWGARTFVLEERGTYIEVFAVTSMTPSPGISRDDSGDQTSTSSPPPVDRTAITTLCGTPVEKLREIHHNEPTGKHADYIVLIDEERAKGFVRPVRDSYKHVGAPGPKRILRDLTPEEHELYDRFNYIKYEEYSESERPQTGRFWTKTDLDRIGKGCGSVTSMGLKLAETYARDPRFYGSTFCTACNAHFPVGEAGEFVWDGTNERVGT